MSREKIHLDLNSGHLFDGKSIRHVKKSEEIKIDKPDFDYSIHLFQFVKEDGGIETKQDGCLFEIKPGNSTRPMKITEKGYVSQRYVVEGSGWYLSFKDGVLKQMRVSSDDSENVMIEMETGAVDCWVADPRDTRGLKVVDISEPPFDSKFEIEQLEEKKQPSKAFWEIRNKLIKGEDLLGELQETALSLVVEMALLDRDLERMLRPYRSPFGIWPLIV